MSNEFQGCKFGLTFTEGSLKKGIEVQELKTENEYVDFIQEMCDASMICAIYDWDENKQVDKKTPRKEIRLVLESYNMMLCCKTRIKTEYKILEIFSVVNKPSNSVKNIVYATKLACKWKVFARFEDSSDEVDDARKLINALKRAFDAREKEQKKQDTRIMEEAESKENIRKARQKAEIEEIKAKELIVPNNILRAQEIPHVVRYVFSYATSFIYISLPWIRQTG